MVRVTGRMMRLERNSMGMMRIHRAFGTPAGSTELRRKPPRP